MKNTTLALMLGASLIATVTAGWNTALAGGHTSVATANLRNLEGVKMGDATITPTAHGVLVRIKVTGLPPGAKGVHFHAMADCDAGTNFKSSLGHHGEGKGDHGLLNPNGPGKGDLGNIFVAADGTGEMQFFKTDVFLDTGDLPLLDSDGTAIVIHANQDDQLAQPIGGAGPRIACGLVEVG